MKCLNTFSVFNSTVSSRGAYTPLDIFRTNVGFLRIIVFVGFCVRIIDSLLSSHIAYSKSYHDGTA